MAGRHIWYEAVGGAWFGSGSVRRAWTALSFALDPGDQHCGNAVRPTVPGRNLRLGSEAHARGLAGARDRVGRGAMPCDLSPVFRELDAAALERAPASWVRQAAGPAAVGHVAVDGKWLRGSRAGECPGVHLLAAFCAGLEGVIGELHVAPGTNQIIAARRC